MHICAYKKEDLCAHRFKTFLHTTSAYPYPRQLMTMLGPQKEGVNTNFLRAGVERVWWATVGDLTLPKEGCRISTQRVLLFRVATDMVLFNVKHFQGKSASKTTARFFFKINVLKFNLSF